MAYNGYTKQELNDLFIIYSNNKQLLTCIPNIATSTSIILIKSDIRKNTSEGKCLHIYICVGQTQGRAWWRPWVTLAGVGNSVLSIAHQEPSVAITDLLWRTHTQKHTPTHTKMFWSKNITKNKPSEWLMFSHHSTIPLWPLQSLLFPVVLCQVFTLWGKSK